MLLPVFKTEGRHGTKMGISSEESQAQAAYIGIHTHILSP